MSSNSVSDRDTVLALFDEYEAVCEKMAALTFGALSLPELLDLQSRLERQTCRTPVIDNALITEMQTRTTPQAIGAKSWADVLATRMRISLSAAKHRIADAAAFAARTTLTGEPLPPQLPAIAAAQAEGRINSEHLAVIRKFFSHPPVPLDAPTTARVDNTLARIAGFPRHSAALFETDRVSPQPGRHPSHRRETCSPTRIQDRPPRRRRDVLRQGLAGPRRRRHHGRGAHQAGRSGHVQPRR